MNCCFCLSPIPEICFIPLRIDEEDASRRRSSDRRDAIAANTSAISHGAQWWSISTPRVWLPWLRSRGKCLSSHELCLDQYGNDGTSGQAEGLVTKNAEERGAFTGVSGYADDGGGVGCEELVKHDLRSIVLCATGLRSHTIPELIVPGGMLVLTT
jgi:hypothetical protein